MKLIITNKMNKQLSHLPPKLQIQVGNSLETIVLAQSFTGIPHFKQLKDIKAITVCALAIIALGCVGTVNSSLQNRLIGVAIFIKRIRHIEISIFFICFARRLTNIVFMHFIACRILNIFLELLSLTLRYENSITLFQKWLFRLGSRSD